MNRFIRATAAGFVAFFMALPYVPAALAASVGDDAAAQVRSLSAGVVETGGEGAFEGASSLGDAGEVGSSDGIPVPDADALAYRVIDESELPRELEVSALAQIGDSDPALQQGVGDEEVPFGWVDGERGERYYYKASGAQARGWTKIDDTWYYFDPSSLAMVTGWLDWGGKRYYFDGSGAEKYGWLKLDDGWRYLGTDGYLRTGWFYSWGKWYYARADGTTVTGWLPWGKSAYWFDENGTTITGWRKIDGVWRYFDADGRCDKIGYQTPADCYRVSSASVKRTWPSTARFDYIASSRISADATREQCVEAIVAQANEYLGTRYVWDYACAPGVGVDCSGLVTQCLYAVGMETPYNPYEHFYNPWQDHNAENMARDAKWTEVPLEGMQRGDLVFYPGHVAIYVGNDLVIEAYNTRFGVCVGNVWRTPAGANRTPTVVRRPCP